MSVVLRHGGLGGVVRLDFPHRKSIACACGLLWFGQVKLI